MSEVDAALAAAIPEPLVRRMMRNFEKAKREFRLGNAEDGLVAGGRFAEVVFSILHWAATGRAKTGVDEHKLFQIVSNYKGPHEESLIHLYRAARDVYSMRNRKRSAHETELDPTDLDAVYVNSTLDWIVAEFLRTYHSPDLSAVRTLMRRVMRRQSPQLEEIEGHPALLDERMSCADSIECLLYWKYGEQLSIGFLYENLEAYFSKANVRVSLQALLSRRLVFKVPHAGHYVLTERGLRHFEDEVLQPMGV